METLVPTNGKRKPSHLTTILNLITQMDSHITDVGDRLKRAEERVAELEKQLQHRALPPAIVRAKPELTPMDMYYTLGELEQAFDYSMKEEGAKEKMVPVWEKIVDLLLNAREPPAKRKLPYPAMSWKKGQAIRFTHTRTKRYGPY